MRKQAAQYPGMDFLITCLDEVQRGEVKFYPRFDAPGGGQVQTSWNAVLEEVMFDRLTPEEGCKQIQDEVQAAHDEAMQSV
jgi:hypothetical protein